MKEKYKLFLDDIRSVEAVVDYMHARIGSDSYVYSEFGWVVVKNFKEFKETIESKGLPDFVSFDHDLADVHYDPSTQRESFHYQEETGLDCAEWLINYCKENNLEFPEYAIHSMNPIGSRRIKIAIESM